MEKLSKITAPAGEKLRQLQKIVQDIKKNDDSLFNRLKRFQTEQTANILKTGRNTLDRITKKGPPNVPPRDYPGDDPEWSETDFESDEYENPLSENEGTYEPPPCEKVFTPAPSISYPQAEYVDKCPGRPSQAKPMLLLPPPAAEKKKQAAMDDQEDYVEPADDEDDDNYIDPSKKDSPANKGKQHGRQARSHSPDVYEVPDMEEPLVTSRPSTRPPPSGLRLPPKASPRGIIKKPPPSPDSEEDDDYEVCNDDSPSSSPVVPERPEKKTTADRKPSIPIPLPRELKHTKPPLFQKPGVSTRNREASPARTTRSPPTPAAAPAPGFFREKHLPREIPHQKPPGAERGSLSREDSGTRQQEEEAGVYKKPWYASTCDRRTAEDALIRTAKDGSYLVRKSSGVDALQPYTLVVFYKGRVYNIPVRYIPTMKQYALGKQKNGEERFSSVAEMIENHQQNALVLVDTQSNTKDSTKLRHVLKL